jgi:hypothetical protein
LNDFAVIYRYDLLVQSVCPEKTEVIETVRLIHEHILARITALSSNP